jgi:hypothetical protein
VAITTRSASTSPSAWIKLRLHGSSHLRSTRSTSRTSVTTPPEIIPYYRLNHSIWSLSDNK